MALMGFAAKFRRGGGRDRRAGAIWLELAKDRDPAERTVATDMNRDKLWPGNWSGLAAHPGSIVNGLLKVARV
jgi:hypothetical protein